VRSRDTDRGRAPDAGGREWTIGPEDAGRRVDTWLARRAEVGSRARAGAWIARGKIFLNGLELALADAGRPLKAGDHVRLWEDRPGSARRAAREVAAARHRLRIAHEDRALLVADKPPGLLVEPLPGDGPTEVTLLDLVADHVRATKRTRPLVVHRIDRDTSGLVLFAKTPQAQEALKQQFARRRAERLYLAVLRGQIRPAAGMWSDRLTWDADRRLQRRAHPREARAREAIARYRVLEQFDTAALVEVSLVTGKRNQIRVQAGLRGHPLIGERQYTFGAPPMARGEPTLNRQALHAHRLSFRHPVTGTRLSVTAPVPDDLARLIESLRGETTG
jgi:23S rRNA pseudouridine1911/1915/1917 synthase